MKKILKYAINQLANFDKLNYIFSGFATILMFHRIAEKSSQGIDANENMKVSPEYLDNFIAAAKEYGYTFISLDELHKILVEKKKVHRQLVITFDDGYKDNYHAAYPILKKHNIPFCIYIATSMPNKKGILWWYAIEDLIKSNNEIVLSNGHRVSCKDKNEYDSAFSYLRDFIIKNGYKDLTFFENLFKNYQIDWYSYCDNLSMSWKEISKLSKDNLVTIGGHTDNHLILKNLTANQVYDEINNGLRDIESQIGIKVKHFSYPYGGPNEIGNKEFQILKKFNFKTATTTYRGSIFFGLNNFENLPRIMVDESFSLKKLPSNLFLNNSISYIKRIF